MSFCAPKSLKRSLGAVLLTAGFSLAAGACSEAPAGGDCAKLLAHFADRYVNAGTASDAEKAKQKTALIKEMRERGNFVARCQKNIKSSQVACALKSKTDEELEACDS